MEYAENPKRVSPECRKRNRVGNYIKTKIMEQESMTFEQIESHLKSGNVQQYEQQGNQEAFDPAAKLKQVCGIYRTVRPVISAILGFPLIPGSIKTPMRTFMNVMNSVCP